MRMMLSVSCLLALSSCAEFSPKPSNSPGFDPKRFLCSFSDSPRFSQAERSRARLKLSAALGSLGLEPKVHAYDAGRIGSGVNAYAELMATVPSDEWIVLGAHYDTVRGSPGADDDASGVAAVFMVAERLIRLEERRVNVLLAFFDQEEHGLVGSAAFAEWLQASSRRPVAAHCLDMVGWDGDKDRAVELGRGGVPDDGADRFVSLYREAAGRAPGVGSVTRTDLGRSDHVSFINRGIPAVLVIEEYVGGDSSPYYHRQTDTCETIDYEYLRAVADLVAEAVSVQIE